MVKLFIKGTKNLKKGKMAQGIKESILSHGSTKAPGKSTIPSSKGGVETILEN